MAVDKVAEEWTVIRYFREQYASFPKGKLVKSESPDFILKLNRKKRIGIELTRLDHSSKDYAGSGFEVLDELLDKKENKLRLYKKRLLNEYWLIISIEAIDPGQFSTYSIQHASAYDKVFLFELFSGKIEEIA